MISQNKIVPLRELSLRSDFMFGEVMRTSEICQLFLEELLGISIQHIEFIDKQKDLSDSYTHHGIRLDVYLKDEAGTVFNVEMQSARDGGLAKRARYYQGAIDRSDRAPPTARDSAHRNAGRLQRPSAPHRLHRRRPRLALRPLTPHAEAPILPGSAWLHAWHPFCQSQRGRRLETSSPCVAAILPGSRGGAWRGGFQPPTTLTEAMTTTPNDGRDYDNILSNVK